MSLLSNIIFFLQIQLILISVNCLKNPESNLVIEEKTDNNFKKELLEQVLGPNYKSAIQYDIKDNKPQVQIFTDDKITSNNNNNQMDLTKYQNYLKQQNYMPSNYAPQHYNHQVEHNNYSNKIPQTATAQQKEITEILNNRNNHKRDNHNQIKKPCSGKKHKHNDDQPTPTYFYPKHTKGELVVHNPAPIIVKRPPTKVVVNHPAIIVRPQPVLINRTPQAINPVMVYKPQPAPPAPVFVKFESAVPSSHPHNHHHHHHQQQHQHQHSGYAHRISDHDDDHDHEGIYGEGTNIHLNGSPYYNNDGQSPRYNLYNN